MNSPSNAEILRRLNSMTKYPSIPTYHAIGYKGRLLEDTVKFTGKVIATEKVDGTNARIIIPPHSNYFIGSREDLLTYAEDTIYNPALGIVEGVRELAENAVDELSTNMLLVLFVELFGGGVGRNAKNYTTSQTNTSARMFDIMTMSSTEFAEKRTWTTDKIASWRDHGGQHFLSEGKLNGEFKDIVEVTPRIWEGNAKDLPTSIDDMHDFMLGLLPKTNVALDETGRGKPEGIVFRTHDRGIIAKARFEDYERTKRMR